MPPDNLTPIFGDIRNSALNMSTRGFADKDKFALLQKGINSIGAFYWQHFLYNKLIVYFISGAYRMYMD